MERVLDIVGSIWFCMSYHQCSFSIGSARSFRSLARLAGDLVLPTLCLMLLMPVLKQELKEHT